MVSIIIPVYNVEQYLIKCLESCFLQSYTDIEVLAINDGSCDSSGEILDNYARKEPRLRVFHQSNSGVVAARNLGISNAKGEFLMFVDSDDWLACNAVEVLFNDINKNNSDISIADYCEYYAGLNYIKHHAFPECGVIAPEKVIDMILQKKIQWGMWAKLYCKSIFFQIQKEVPFRLGEDAAIFVQLIMQSRSISIIDHVVYTYLQRPDSAVHEKRPYSTDIFHFRKWINNYLVLQGYRDEQKLELFLIDGFIECAFMGCVTEMYRENTPEIRKAYTNGKVSLAFWQRLVYRSTILSPVVGRVTVWGARRIQKFRFYIQYLRKYNLC